jgi:predicted ribosomally synthesized peptide with SipW-like signal peptide
MACHGGDDSMPHEIDCSRRRVLAALGTVGAAASGAGMGTSAYFSDRETFTNSALSAGSLDMKASYSVHYSDWSDDELTGIDETSVTMTDAQSFDPGPRSLPGIEFAAETDLQRFLENTRLRDEGSATCPDGTDAEDLAQPVIDLSDVKPGDFGEVTFDFALCDNPGYVWLQVDTAHASEGGYTEPERDDPDESGPTTTPEGELDVSVELLDVVRAAYWIDDGDNYVDGDETVSSAGTLREIIDELAALGVALAGDVTASEGGGTGTQGCFSATTERSVGLVWWVPVDHGNEMQTDSVEFDLSFHTEQCRHNAGRRDKLSAFLNADAALKASPVWDGTVVDRTGTSEVTIRNGATTSVTGVPFATLPVAFDPQVVRVSPETAVSWQWPEPAPGVPPIPHNVVALDGSYASGAPEPPDDPPPEFTHTFTANETGVNLYYCTPHGAPNLVESALGGEVLNEFGMRGAVVVEAA